ncbi:MAG TPA: hypothetical protein PK299_03415 [Anaerolineales bacterium]|nr:hypothetical protein [Anaerolineales bacterium]
MSNYSRISKTLVLSLIFANLFIISIYSVQAASSTISEFSGGFGNSGGTFNSYNPCPSGWTCQNSNVKYVYLYGTPSTSTQIGSTGPWSKSGSWIAGQNISATTYWRAYIPSNGNTNQTWAGVQYQLVTGGSGPSYATNVDQNNWKNKWVQVGSLPAISVSSYLVLRNHCVTGFSCSSSRPLFYDSVNWNTSNVNP